MKPEKIMPIETIKVTLHCSAEGCRNAVNGHARKGEYNDAAKAAARARRQAFDLGYENRGSKENPKWLCAVCVAKEMAARAEKDHEDRTDGAFKRVKLRASAAAREAMEKKRIEKEKAAKRRTKPVGRKTADADSTLTKETQKLVFTNEFERVVLRRLDPRQITAADEWRRQMEIADGVSDHDVFSEKVDHSTTPGHPSIAQMDALRWRAMVKQHVGAENVTILDLTIGEDWLPIQIGQKYSLTRDAEKRSAVGMAFIRVALTQLADFMRLRG